MVEDDPLVHIQPRGLLAYLEELHSLRSCAGFEDRAQQTKVRGRSTVYRWRQRLRSSLQVFPSFALEGLGLVHVHLFLRGAQDVWLRFPYAVEHAWLTPDFVESVLYLHCIIPRVHEKSVRALLARCRDAGWCKSMTVLASGSGWQQLFLSNNALPSPEPPLAAHAPGLLRDDPLLVPVVFESWGGQESFAAVWQRIASRSGRILRSYVPRGRLYRTNGKAHVKAALDHLERAGLFRQYVIRYDDLLATNHEVFLVVRNAHDWLLEFLEAIRPVARVIEQHPAEQGSAVLRVIGGYDLLNALLQAQSELQKHGAHVFVRNKHHPDPVRVRFCYEFLFDQHTGNWVYPEETVLAHMRGAA